MAIDPAPAIPTFIFRSPELGWGIPIRGEPGSLRLNPNIQMVPFSDEHAVADPAGDEIVYEQGRVASRPKAD